MSSGLPSIQLDQQGVLADSPEWVNNNPYSIGSQAGTLSPGLWTASSASLRESCLADNTFSDNMIIANIFWEVK